MSGRLQPAVGSDDHIEGMMGAPVTLVEYGDYQCPSCGEAYPIVKTLQLKMKARLRFVFRNFPLTEVHPFAFHAASVAESVAAHAGEEAFWTMHDALFEHQGDSRDALDDEHLLDYAEAAGADREEVSADLDRDGQEERVHADFMSGVKSGVNGTPTFFINGQRFGGDWTNLAEFTAALEAAAK